jgi:hypothetical protein
MQIFAIQKRSVIWLSLLAVILVFTGCGSASTTAKTWVGSSLQSLLDASRHGQTAKANMLPNGHWEYVTSDYSMSECKTYWEVNDQNIIVGFRRDKGSWKCSN